MIKQNLKLSQAIGFIAVGVILTLLLFALTLLLLAAKPLSDVGLSLPNSSGKPDLRIEISQEYINREIAHSLVKKPIVVAVARVSDVKVEVLNNSQLNVSVRITGLGRQLDVFIKERIAVKNNQLVLEQIENTKVENVSLAILNGIVGQVNEIVATKLNELIMSVGSARSQTTGELLGRIPTLLGVSTSNGVVIAEFNVTIATTP